MDQIYKTDLNELFSYQRKGEKLEEKEKVIEIEIERLRDFKEHPFHVKDDKEMSLLKESIKNYGILSPLIVRPVLDGDPDEQDEEMEAILSSLIEKLQQIRDQHFYSLNLQEYLNNIEEDTDDA